MPLTEISFVPIVIDIRPAVEEAIDEYLVLKQRREYVTGVASGRPASEIYTSQHFEVRS